jgi:hypothetical protein
MQLPATVNLDSPFKRLHDELGREWTASFFSVPYHLVSLVQAAVTKYLKDNNQAESEPPQASTTSILTAITWDIILD